jgi:hypothetical protein
VPHTAGRLTVRGVGIMKRHCSYCGTQRFGLIRRSGYYFRGYSLVQLQFCTQRHKELFAAEYVSADHPRRSSSSREGAIERRAA